MKSYDADGAPVANASPAIIAAFDVYVDEFLKYGANLRALFAAADAHPDCALLQAHAAALHMAFETEGGWKAATPYVAAMRNSDQSAPRERLFCAAIERWYERDFHGALRLIEDLADEIPEDLCALKWGQYHAFNLGDQAALLSLADTIAQVHRNRPYAHGMIAFAMEQNHRLDEAEEEARSATEIAADDAWAHHALAHVFESRGDSAGGAAWMADCAPHWDGKGVFIRDHNWWHAALFRLGLGDDAGALAIYDARLWGAMPEFPQEQLGAISMLWRLEMRGVDVGARWAPVLEEVRERIGDHVLPFHDLHYLYALARAGEPDEAEAFLGSIKSHAAIQKGAARNAWAQACLPCAEAIADFAADRFEAAAANFSKASPALRAIGGSHAQRYLFAETRRAALQGARGRLAS